MSWNALYIIDLLAFALFLTSYYRNCYRKGYRVDLWHAQLLLYCVIPYIFMLPFARNRLNALVLENDFSIVVAAVPEVFLISMLGFAALVVGGSFWALRLGVGARQVATRVLRVVPHCSLMLMSSRSVLVFQSLLCLFMQSVLLAFYFAHSGFGFDLRAYTFANPVLRPVALIISNYSIVLASHCLARYVDRKERVLLLCVCLLSSGLLFFGARSNILAIFINVMLCYLVKLRDRISLVRITILVTALVLLGLYLGNVRAGQYSVTEFFGVLASLLLFGDTFSDLRDFAWVYARWDHVLWGGKTYLAALTSFVPRFASEFRDTWGLGVATGTTIGLDPQLHPGVRPGIFGEGYFNFGLLGVVAVGLLVGIIFRRIDLDVKSAMVPTRASMMEALAATMLVHVALAIAISSSFSNLYVLAGIYSFSWLCLRAKRLVSLRPAPAFSLK